MGIHVAFDIGNVLCHFDIKKFTNVLANTTNISDHEAFFFLERLQKLQDIGVTSVACELETHFKLPAATIHDLVECWNSTVCPDASMMNLLENLRADDVKIAFLSNMGVEHISHLRASYPELFERTIQHISCEVGARKPTKIFFQSFCSDNDEFSGCVYVDDIDENLRAGKKYGFKGYSFKLEEYSKLSASQQKIELAKMKNMIINMNAKPTGTEIY
jgi:FMN phosphatase YigB (HAD superfamily)